MSEVAMPEVLDALSKIGEQWELGESVWRVWGCILFKSCPVSHKEIVECSGYSSGLISLNLRKLKMADMINAVSMGGETRYSVNTNLTDAFGRYSKRFFEDNIKKIIALLSENLDKIEDAKVKNTFCELINECKKLSPLVFILSRIIEDINAGTIKTEKKKEKEKGGGIVALTGTFRDGIADIKEGAKIVFTGSVAVCTPFIELLAYAVRDRGFEIIYVPGADANEAREVRKIDNIGYSVVDAKANPKDPDAVVVLGGLAMPKFGCSSEDVSRMIEDISGEKRPKIIGVSFMDMFERAGWDNMINFDTLIDATL